jgi:hypothetical protein
MSTPLQPALDSWLALVGSVETVLGPSHGHTPDLGAYRIAYAHLTPSSMWLFGSIIGLPHEAEINGSRGGVSKFNLALDISVRRLISISGQPEFDPEHDDSMHGFELARPIALSVRQTDELVWPDAKHRVLHLVAESSHFSFELLAMFVHAYGGKHAKRRFLQALHVRD